MRDLFRRISGQKAEELEKKLAELTAKLAETHRENSATLETMTARDAARLAWVDNIMARTEKKYLELCESFESGDIKQVFSALYGVDKEALGIALRVPVRTPEGQHGSFVSWADSAFKDADRLGGLKNTITEFVKKDIAPAFEDITAPAAPAMALPPAPQSSLAGRLSGSYEADLQKRISNIAVLIDIREPAELEARIAALQDDFARKIAERLDHAGKKLETVLVVRRMEAALGGGMDENRPLLEQGLAYLEETFGAQEVPAWLAAPVTGDDTPRIIRMLEASSGDPAAQAKTLEMVFGFFADKPACALFLRDVAQDVPAAQAEALNALTYALAGDFVGTADAIIAPASCGFVEPYGKNTAKIRAAVAGRDVQLTLGEDAAARISVLLGARPGFMRVGESEEIANPTSVTRSYYRDNESGGKLHTDYFGHGWNRTLPHDEAQALLDAMAAQDNDFIQLGDKTNIRKSAVSHAWQSAPQDGRPSIKYVIGNTTHAIVNLTGQESVRKYLDAFSEGDGFYLSATEIAKASSIANAWIIDIKDDGSCRLKFIIGEKTYHADMSAGEAEENIRLLVDKFGHARLGRDECFNPAQCSAVWYGAAERGKPGSLRYIVADRNCSTLMPAKQADKVLKEAEKDHGFIRYSQRGIFNPALVNTVEYAGGKLELDGRRSMTMTPDEAAPVLGALEQRGGFIRLAGAFYASRDEVTFARMTGAGLEIGFADRAVKKDLPEEDARKILDALFDRGARQAISRDLGIEIKAGDAPLAALLAHYRGAFQPLPEQAVAAPVADETPETVLPEPEALEQQQEEPESPKPAGDSRSAFDKFNI